MPLDGRAEVTSRVCDGHRLGAEADRSSLAVWLRHEPHTFAAKEDFRSRPPGLRLGWLQGLTQKLSLQPRHIPFREPPGLRERSAARNRDAGGTVGAEAEDITPCEPITDKPESHSPRAGDEPVVVRRGERFRSKAPFELHPTI